MINNRYRACPFTFKVFPREHFVTVTHLKNMHPPVRMFVAFEPWNKQGETGHEKGKAMVISSSQEFTSRALRFSRIEIPFNQKSKWLPIE